MILYTENNKNSFGIILGLIYTVYFNLNEGEHSTIVSLVYSIPFILFSLLISVAISKIRKDENYGIYFCVICLILLNIK